VVPGRTWGREWGYPIGTHAQFGSTEAEQASFIAESLDIWHEWSFAGPLFLFMYRDAGTNPADYRHAFGIVYKDFRPKQAPGRLHGQDGRTPTLTSAVAANLPRKRVEMRSLPPQVRCGAQVADR
jgi:hypothetical protein